MKILNSLIVAITIVVVVGCGKGKVIEFEKLVERGGLKYEINSEKPFTGTAVSYYENKRKQSESSYRKGKADGKTVYWYENGQKQYEFDYRDGEALKTSGWYENGQMQFSCEMRNGKPHGNKTNWYENGQKKEEGKYIDGIPDGENTSWYENGQKKEVAEFDNGKLIGEYIEWYENGQKKSEIQWRSNEIVKRVAWDENGNQVDWRQIAEKEERQNKVYTRNELRQAVIGKNQEAVVALLGKPAKTKEADYMSIWYYEGRTKDTNTGAMDDYVAVWFKRGFVENVIFP